MRTNYRVNSGVNFRMFSKDQLQEMLGYRYPINYAVNLGRWCDHLTVFEYSQFHLYSMEQLWLAFVMLKRFGKVWSNGEWIKEE